MLGGATRLAGSARDRRYERYPLVQFSYGFHLLWSGELEPAARELSQTLAATRELGNRLLQTQCLTYLTIVERRRGNFEQVAELARESLEAAQAIRRVDYIGAAQANQAWLAWRMGDLEGTNRLGQAALEAWNTDSHPYPLQGLGIWPLVAVRLTRGEVNEAVEPARRLLDPAQQRLPAEMAALLEQAFHSHDEADWEAARLSLSRALELAQNRITSSEFGQPPELFFIPLERFWNGISDI